MLPAFTLVALVSAGPPTCKVATSHEVSGTVWHPTRELLYTVGDFGQVAGHDRCGVQTYFVDNSNELDLEDLAIVDPEDGMLYLGVEHPASIMQWDIDKRRYTGKQWVLQDFPNDPLLGMEGLTYFPNTGDPAGGFFLAGSQKTGELYKYRLNTSEDQYLGEANKVGHGVKLTFVGTGENNSTLGVNSTLGEISGISYNPPTGTIYVVSDIDRLMIQYDVKTEKVLDQVNLWVKNAEGVATMLEADGRGEIWFGKDDGAEDSGIFHMTMPNQLCFENKQSREACKKKEAAVADKVASAQVEPTPSDSGTVAVKSMATAVLAAVASLSLFV